MRDYLERFGSFKKCSLRRNGDGSKNHWFHIRKLPDYVISINDDKFNDKDILNDDAETEENEGIVILKMNIISIMLIPN